MEPTRRDALFDELRATREHGCSVSDEDITPGVGSLGAPIFDHTNAVRAALSVGGMRAQVFANPGRAIELVRDGAAEISRALGHDGSLPAA